MSVQAVGKTREGTAVRRELVVVVFIKGKRSQNNLNPNNILTAGVFELLCIKYACTSNVYASTAIHFAPVVLRVAIDHGISAMLLTHIHRLSLSPLPTLPLALVSPAR